MKKELKILMWENNDSDAKRIERQLHRGGFSVRVQRVNDQKDFLEALDVESPDLILSEHRLPEVNGFELRAIASQKCPEVPFIFVTGLSGVEKDVETMGRANMAYVLKNRLSDLGPLIHQALFSAKPANEYRERLLSGRLESAWQLLSGVPDYAICQLDGAGRLTSWNIGARKILGYDEDEILGWNFSCFYLPDNAAVEQPSEALKQALAEGHFREETVWVRKGGVTFWADVLVAPLPRMPEAVPGFVLVVQDITIRKEAENEREQVVRGLQATLNEVKILSGLVPICASCKKVRDYKGQWHPLEIYLRDHSEATLTHEFCEDCSRLILTHQNIAPAAAAVVSEV